MSNARRQTTLSRAGIADAKARLHDASLLDRSMSRESDAPTLLRVLGLEVLLKATQACEAGRQPFAGTDAGRHATWPASRLRSSSVQRAKRHAGVRGSAQTFGVTPMTLATRAASETAVWAFAAVALATAAFYIFGINRSSIATVAATAFALGSFAAVTAFFTVLALGWRRFRGKGPVLGAIRGASIGVLILLGAAIVHAVFTFGSAGLPYSLFGQAAYALVLLGGPFAIAGGFLGRSIERRFFSCRGT